MKKGIKNDTYTSVLIINERLWFLFAFPLIVFILIIICTVYSLLKRARVLFLSV